MEPFETSKFTVRYAQERPARRVSATFEALAGESLYSNSPDVLGQERARKALARALKARTPKRWTRPKLNLGVELASLPPGGAGSQHPQDRAQERAYAENTGREWADVDPEPTAEAFGCPPHPDYPRSEHTYSNGYMGKRSTKADDERRAAWTVEMEAWYPLSDAWGETDDAKRYQAALRLWRARREQFGYNPRKRGAATVLADCASTLPGLEDAPVFEVAA